MRKRWLALLLAAAAVLSLLGVSALAADGEQPVAKAAQTREAEADPDGAETAGEDGGAPEEEEPYIPDPEGMITFENLERRMRENNLTLLALEENVQAIRVIDVLRVMEFAFSVHFEQRLFGHDGKLIHKIAPAEDIVVFRRLFARPQPVVGDDLADDALLVRRHMADDEHPVCIRPTAVVRRKDPARHAAPRLESRARVIEHALGLIPRPLDEQLRIAALRKSGVDGLHADHGIGGDALVVGGIRHRIHGFFPLLHDAAAAQRQ